MFYIQGVTETCTMHTPYGGQNRQIDGWFWSIFFPVILINFIKGDRMVLVTNFSIVRWRIPKLAQPAQFSGVTSIYWRRSMQLSWGSPRLPPCLLQPHLLQKIASSMSTSNCWRRPDHWNTWKRWASSTHQIWSSSRVGCVVKGPFTALSSEASLAFFFTKLRSMDWTSKKKTSCPSPLGPWRLVCGST